MQAEHYGWFQPGSISFSFVAFAVCTVIMVGVIAFLVRSMTKRYGTESSSHH